MRHRRLTAALTALARHALVAFAMIAPLGGCVGSDACPAGENRICRDANDCRCGKICQVMEDCSGRDVCARFRDDPTGPGVCVDILWLVDDAPCIPLCREQQVCVAFEGRGNSCQDVCNSASDCATGCCVPLSDGRRACAPERFCNGGGCNPPCGEEQLCVGFSSTPVCAAACSSDADCTSCCVPLQNGGGACSPSGAFCPRMPPPPCRTLTDCTRVEVSFTPAPEAACGAHGSYEGALLNACGEPAECRACWWSESTRSYSDCAPLGQIPSGATVPLDVTRCAEVPFPDPPVRIHCVDRASFASRFDCLGAGPL